MKPIQVIDSFYETDPVCLMNVDINDCQYIFDYNAKKYYFCCNACLLKFKNEPQKYLNFGSATKLAQNEIMSSDLAIKYSCPMDPDVVSDKLVNCLKCGMLLEPQNADSNETFRHNLKFFKGSLLFTFPVLFVQSFICNIKQIDSGYLNLLNIFLLLISLSNFYLYGWPIVFLGLKSFVNKKLNMYSLLSIGVLAPLIISIYQFVPYLLNKAIISHEVLMQLLSSQLIIIIYWMGQIFESQSMKFSQINLLDIKNFMPLYVDLVVDDKTQKVPIEEVKLNDIILIKPKDKISFDAIITEGETAIDESSITGESSMVAKKIGDYVYLGTFNGNGAIKIKVTKLSNDSFMNSIINQIKIAKSSKIAFQNTIDKFSAIFIILVFVVSIATFLYYWMILKNVVLARESFLNVLLVSCPCALGLAAPSAILITTGILAKIGVVFSDVNKIEILSKVSVLVTDKTGTLTYGNFNDFEIINFSDIEDNELIKLAASVECYSNHVLAKAFAIKADILNLKLEKCINFINYPSCGVGGQIGDRKILIGNMSLMKTNNIDFKEFNVDEYQTYLAIDNKLCAQFNFKDSINSTAHSFIEELYKRGIKVHLASGDNSINVQKVADELKISNFAANLTPEQKLEIVKNYQAHNEVVLFLGDGINDTPAFSQSDLSISCANGSNIAKNTCDILLLNQDLRQILRAQDVVKLMIGNIKSNLVLASFYNFCAIAMASGFWADTIHFRLNPMMSCFMMSVSSVLITLNSNTLKITSRKFLK